MRRKKASYIVSSRRLFSPRKRTAVIRTVAILCFASMQGACTGGPSSNLDPAFGTSGTSGTAGAPVQLNASPQRSGPASPSSIVSPVSASIAQKAINNYRINQRGKESPYIYQGADLDGDGRPEILAYFTGESWCAKTGCTLAVLRSNGQRYTTVSTIRRVKLPVTVRAERTNGWRTLVVKTGGGGLAYRSVALKFSGRGYPGNATLVEPIPPGGDGGYETIIDQPAAPALSAAPAFQSAPNP